MSTVIGDYKHNVCTLLLVPLWLDDRCVRHNLGKTT